jgi:spermidine synthase
VCGSGLCALIYQVAWERELRLVFGASTAASAAVVAVFIGGLGLGSLWLGRRAERHARPLLLYARLEAGIALGAAVSPGLLALVRWVYVHAGGTAVLGGTLGTVVRLALAALVLAVPTVLMGGTLPALARATQSDEDRSRRVVAVLYGVNTLGAVTGALLATFVLLEALGTRRTLWVAGALNLGVAACAAALARGRRTTSGDAAGRASAAPPPPAAPVGLVLAAAALVGFVFFLMEMVWYRMLAPLLGGTIFTFGLILATALFGIGVGGALYGAIGARRRPGLGALAATCLIEALGLAVPLALGDRLAVLALLCRPGSAVSLGAFVLGWVALTAIVVLPAALVAGLQFPLLFALLGEGRREVGRQVGLVYAWNTLGAAAGALAGGFGLMAALTAPGCWRLAIALLLGLGVTTAAVAARPPHRLRTLALAGLLAVGVAALLAAPGPTAVWRHGGVGVGRFPPRIVSSTVARRDWMQRQRRQHRWHSEGIESSVALSMEAGLAFTVNGKVDGNARLDAATQVMGPMLGALLHPDPRRALVIGLGTGSSAGWLGAIPRMERVDVIELEPAIAHVARACAAVNQRVLENPRVHLTFGDAREVLQTSRGRYDLVFSEPSNPYRAGVASLFTVEYYRAVRDRLAPGGTFLQWVQGYDVDLATIATIYATLTAVFPVVETWELRDEDLLLVATDAAAPHDLGRLRARLREEPYRGAARAAWRALDLEGVFGHYLARSSFAPAVGAGATANTDDRTIIEFGFARLLGRRSHVLAELRATAYARGEHRPAVSGGALDFERVDQAQAAIRLEAEEPPPAAAGASAAVARRVAALRAYLTPDYAEVRRGFAADPRPPATGFELSAVAEALAEDGDERAAALAAELAAVSPPEADAVRARLHLRAGRRAAAVAALEAAFAECRRDPWPWPVVISRALTLAEEIAAEDPAAAARLAAALREPFAVANLEAARERARVMIALEVAAPAACVAALGALEPHVPFDAAFLTARRDCYARAGDPRRRPAEADLQALRRLAPPGAR